jgi:hypothetical protein
VFDEMVADAYERGKALNEVIFGVEDTIDPLIPGAGSRQC